MTAAELILSEALARRPELAEIAKAEQDAKRAARKTVLAKYSKQTEVPANDMTERELRRKRDREAEAAGEGSWRNRASGEWCPVEATFYPSLKLWITEKGERREVTRTELDKDYARLEL